MLLTCNLQITKNMHTRFITVCFWCIGPQKCSYVQRYNVLVMLWWWGTSSIQSYRKQREPRACYSVSTVSSHSVLDQLATSKKSALQLSAKLYTLIAIIIDSKSKTQQQEASAIVEQSISTVLGKQPIQSQWVSKVYRPSQRWWVGTLETWLIISKKWVCEIYYFFFWQKTRHIPFKCLKSSCQHYEVYHVTLMLCSFRN